MAKQFAASRPGQRGCHPGMVLEMGRCNHPPRDVRTQGGGPCAWPDGLARKMACEVRERSSVGCLMIRRLLVHTVYNPDVAFKSKARSGGYWFGAPRICLVKGPCLT